MRIMVHIALAVAATLALAGCYVTAKPLITSANAAYPFTDGTTFTAWSWKEDKNDWEQSGSGKVIRVSDHYRMHPNPDPGQESDADDDTDFLLSDLGDGLFAVQAKTHDNEAIMLDVIKVEGDTVIQYVLMCEPEDKQLADQHIIEKFEDGEYNDTCTIGSLDQLRKAFRAKLARGMKPQARYVVTR